MLNATLRKRCSRCELVKPADQFSPNRQDKSGLASRCKSCHNEHARTLRYAPDPSIREKCCTRCKSVKPIEQFSRNRQSSDGFQSACKGCWKKRHRNEYVRDPEKAKARAKLWATNNPEKSKVAARRRHIRRLYGVASEDELLKSQGGKCAGCGDAFDATTPHVDHDHETGVVRGLLCGSCNKTLGMALESTERLLGLVRYLRRPRLQIVDRRQA